VRRTISQRELRNDSAAVLREVEAGQVVVIARRGTPVAELRPVQQPRTYVSRAVLAAAAGRAPRIDARQWRADLDAVVDPSADD
jgi:prevent-host-death family protein